MTSSAVNRLAEWGWIATELLIGGSCIAITVAGFARIPTHTHPIDRPTSSATKCPALLSHTSLALAILFALFACHSAYRVIQAAPSCGCYGDLTVPPLVSFVATAAFSVLLFALSSPAGQASQKEVPSATHKLSPLPTSASLVVVSCFFATGLLIPTGLALASGTSAALIRVADATPEEWESLIAEIPELNPLHHDGAVTVLIVRETCGDCTTELKSLIRDERAGESFAGWMIISVGSQDTSTAKSRLIDQLRTLGTHIHIDDSSAADRLITPQRYCVADAKIQPCRLVAGGGG